MHLDWFTVGAQIGNFLLLLWLLRRFLYRPILDAMASRQQRTAAALAQAESKAAAAEALQRDLLARQQELVAGRDTWLAQAREEVARQRQVWLAQGRAEADEARERWRARLLQEQQDFQQTLHREASQRLLALARRALHDLADSEFEAQAVSVLLRRLQALDGESAQAMAVAAQEGCTVISALPLPEPQRRTLTGGLRQVLGPGLNPNFRSDPTAPWGITLETPSRRLSWNLDSYLDGFAAELEALIPPVAGNHHALVREHA